MNKAIDINEETLQDIINIETGLLYPLEGFMTGRDFHSVLQNYCLADGQVFTVPITLDVEKGIYDELSCGERLTLKYDTREAAYIDVEDKFIVTQEDIIAIYRTSEDAHPGVYKEKKRYPYRIGGKIGILDSGLLQDALKPAETKAIFSQKHWKSVVGFQTRNPIHKAHEHLQRIGLEICDGLFVNPIIGWKKTGDFTQEAVMAAYRKMIDVYYPAERVYMAGLKTQMRYAGPREAIFHAIIRRNLGCTHFIIGRDHAGVGGYYGAYDAHELACELTKKYDLGISLLLLHEPYYCKKCAQIVTDKNCSHYSTERVEISGTKIRKYISEGAIPDEIIFRKDIFEEILKCKQIFIE